MSLNLEKPLKGVHQSVVLESRGTYPLHKKEERVSSAMYRLSRTQRRHDQEPIPPSADLRNSEPVVRR